MLFYDVILDVGKTGCQQTVSLYQGDNRLKTLRITLLQNGRQYVIAPDLNVRLCGVKPDDSEIVLRCGVNGGSVYYLPTARATDTEGTVRCQLQIRDPSGAILFSPEFAMQIVEPTVPVPEFPDGALEDLGYNAEVLSMLSASGDGNALLFNGELVGGIQTASELPETAEEGEVVYLDEDGLFLYAGGAWTRLTDEAIADDLAALQTDSHTHANKSALDRVSTESLLKADVAYNKSHTHDNIRTLNTLTENRISYWDAAVEDRHSHANKSALDTVTAAKVTSWDTAASDRHSHANKSALDTVTAAKVTSWDTAASDRHSHANKSALDTVTAEKVTSWDAAASDSHSHANKSALDAVTTEKVTSWDAASAVSHRHANGSTLDSINSSRVAGWEAACALIPLLQTTSHTHTNWSVLNELNPARVIAWDVALQNSHTHTFRESLNKLLVSTSYAALPDNAPDGTVGFVTGMETAYKPFSQYDAQTDADAPLTIAPQLVYDATAQMDDSILVVDAGDEVGIGLLPVYESGESDPSFGALEMILTTQQNDPDKYMVFLACDSIMDSDVLEDYEIEVGEDEEATVFFVYAFEAVTGDLETEDGTLAEDLSFAQGWNVIFYIEDEENVSVTVAPVTDPNAYYTPDVFDAVKVSAPDHPFLYDVLQVRTTTDRRGVYGNTGAHWTRYYDDDLQALSGRLTAAERAAHTHQNKDVLDGFGSAEGALCYNGKTIPLTAPDDVTMLGFETYSDLVVRDEAIPGESITDVPVFVQGGAGDVCTLYAQAPGQEYDVTDPFDCIALTELRQADTGMPLLVVRVRMNGVQSVYYPRSFNAGAGTIPAGWTQFNQSSDPPTITDFTPTRLCVGGTVYDSLSDLPDSAKSALRSLSQCINVSAAAMGTIRVPDGALLRFTGTIEPNRRYAFTTGDDCTFTLPAVSWTEREARFGMDLTCTANVRLTFPQGTLFSGVPSGGAGVHKLTGCWFGDASAWGVVCEDYAAASA